MKIDECSYYRAGIAVIAQRFGIRVDRLWIGDKHGLDGITVLESLEDWCKSGAPAAPSHGKAIEDYVTTLLGGAAATFIKAQDRRCHLKRTFGDAGLEENFIRKVWQCLQPEPDRAVAIVVGALSAYDDADAAATTRRLCNRAARLLREPRAHAQLSNLASQLMQAREMSALEVARFFRHA